MSSPLELLDDGSNQDPQHVKRRKLAISRLNARRKTLMSTVFMNQAISHIAFQFLDIENESRKFVNRSALAHIECLDNFTPTTLQQYYKCRYSAMPYHKLLKIATIVLESGQITNHRNSELLKEALFQYRQEFAKNKMYRKIARLVKKRLTNTPCFLLPNTELMQTIGQVRSLSAIAAAKVSRIEEKESDSILS